MGSFPWSLSPEFPLLSQYNQFKWNKTPVEGSAAFYLPSDAKCPFPNPFSAPISLGEKWEFSQIVDEIAFPFVRNN